VKPGPSSGSAVLSGSSAGNRGAHYWQFSIDGGKTWSPTKKSLDAKLTLSGFTPGQTVSFRHSTLTTHGEGDWSDPIALIIR
jgi:hypothetical protein